MDVGMERPQPQTTTQQLEREQLEHRSHTRRYVLIAASMIFLTLLAFLGIGLHVASNAILFPVILAMAVIQVVLQVYLFMHLNTGRRAYSGFFAAGLSIALIVIIGIIILVWVY